MLSDFSVKKPFTIVVAIILVAILGVISFTNMVVDLIPSINLPYVVVYTAYPGASPELVETTVTRTIEQTLSSINNVENVTSVSSSNVSMVIMEFTEDTNMDSAMLEMSESLDLVTDYFPDGCATPMMIKLNPNMLPMAVMAVYAEGQTAAQSSKLIDEKILPEIESVEGIASASASGLLENMVNITISEEKLNAINESFRAEIESKIDEVIEQKKQELFEAYLPLLPEGTTLDSLTDEQLAAFGFDPSSMDTQIQSIMDQIPTIDMTKDMLGGILSGQNFSMPNGSIVENGSSYVVRTGDKFASVDELASLIVYAFPSSAYEQLGVEMDEDFGKYRLSDIADVVSLDNSGSQYVKLNGNDGILVTLQKQSEYSTADVSERLQEKITEIKSEYEAVNFVTLMDQGDYVNLMIGNIIQNLLIGAVIAIIILLLFLKSIRSTFIVGMSIVISLVTSFVVMYFTGITMNIISMGGLALGIGMLVDNSIVVIENIFRLRAEGMSPMEAAKKGAKQISGAITASTLTTIIVFVPILFTTGITKTLFLDMGLTIAFSLIASLVTALTFVPMASSRMYSEKSKEKEHKLFDKFADGYVKLLNHCLSHKWIVTVIVLALVGATVAVTMNMNREFFPETDMGQMSMTINFPDDYKDSDKTAALDEVYGVVSGTDGVDTVGIMMSDGSSGGVMSMMSGGGGASAYVLLSDERTKSTAEIGSDIRKAFDGKDYTVSVETSSMDISALSGSGISIYIYGRELDGLIEQGKKVSELISDIEGLYDVSDGMGVPSNELRITVDKSKAMENGLTVAQVYMAVANALADTKASTSIETDAADYDIYVYDDRDIPVETREQIENLEIETPFGTTVKVTDVAAVGDQLGFSSIRRDNGRRYAVVSASVDTGYSIDKLSALVEEKLESYEFPQGYSYEMSGETETLNSTFKDLVLMLLLAIVFIYLVMVAQFQSLLSPFIVMFTIPLAFTGGILFLWACQMPLSVVAMIGLVVLVGVVVNNGIVFVDYVNQLRAGGMDNREALLRTGKDRIRPIIMTALTTIGALLATFFDASATSSMMKPLAATTIGGLLYATILTLFFVPVVYDVFHKKNKKAKTEEK